MIDNNKLVEVLRKIVDPNTGQDIITLKKVEGLKIDGDNISFQVNLEETDPQIKGEFHQMVEGLIKQEFPNASVHIHFGAAVNTGPKNPIPHIKNIIAVASGKGGVGKSTVAANLALSLKALGAEVGLIDADLYGPSVPTMFDLGGVKPEIKQVYGKNKMVPIEKYGIYLQSIGFIIEPEQAVVLRGPRLGGIIKQFIQEVIWPSLDYLVIDLPPGTGDIQLTLVQTVPVTGAVMVTTPQKVAVADAIKAMNMFMLDNIKVPILGVIENMSWFTPRELPQHKYHLFGSGGGKALAKLGETVLLGQIPLVEEVGKSGDKGVPAVLEENHPAKDYFIHMAKQVVHQLNIRNELLGKTPIVNIK